MLAEAIPEGSQAIRHERVTTFLMLVVDALALRARQIDLDRPLQVSTQAFIDNLIDMSIGALRAASSHP